jgi:hypothetical protein
MALTLKEQAKKFLANVPEEYVFRCCDGTIFRNMQELKDGLDSMTDESFTYHSNTEKKDFSNWVRDIIGDAKLARDLEKAANRTQAAKQAAKQVASRLGILSRRLT